MESPIKNLGLGTILFISATTLIGYSVIRNPAKTEPISPVWYGTQRQEDLEDPFEGLTPAQMTQIFESEGAAGPAGNWTAAAIPDLKQRTGQEVPVILLAPISLMATGRATT